MNVQDVISLYAYNGDSKMVHCQVFEDGYRFIDVRMNGVNSGIIQSTTPLESAYAYAERNKLELSDKINGGHSE